MIGIIISENDDNCGPPLTLCKKKCLHRDSRQKLLEREIPLLITRSLIYSYNFREKQISTPIKYKTLFPTIMM